MASRGWKGLSFLLDYVLGTPGINYKYKRTYEAFMNPIPPSNMGIVLLFAKFKAPGLCDNDAYE